MEPTSATIDGKSGRVQCVEISALIDGDRVASTCFSSDLGVASTFSGEPFLRPVFYSVLTNARKVP